ncbi:lipase 1-like [Armigeres subalbatus]|uniref:lipase 1-like n=1 Tax=Armigeres subalbatus TaxID=124917 RepID=UPI002ED16EB7
MELPVIGRTERYIQRQGLKSESHIVTTEDGYRLTLFRLLPNGKSRGVAILQHGLRQSSASWLLLEQNLPLQLLDQGLEVWLANSRASKEISTHVNENISVAEFWNFSFHEIGYYDLAATVDFILPTSGFERVQLIGFSEGAAAILILLSKRPHYNDRISSLCLVAPAVILPRSSFTVLAALYVTFKPILPWSLQWFVTGSNKHYGNSPKELKHLQHLMLSGRFVEYNYGSKKNRRQYGSSKPPEYPLEKLTCPVVLHYGSADRIVHPRDVKKLAALMVNSEQVDIIRHKKTKHLDFVTREKVTTDVYPLIVESVVKRL